MIMDSMGRGVRVLDTAFFLRPGKDSFWFRSNLDFPSLAKFDKILFQLGTVDMLKLVNFGCISPNSPPNIGLQYASKVKESLLDLISQVRHHNRTAVIIMSGVPPIPRYPFLGPVITECNRLLSLELSTYRRSIFLDLPKSFIGRQYLSYKELFPDNLHVGDKFKYILKNRFTQAFTPTFISEKLGKQSKAAVKRLTHKRRFQRRL